MANLHELKWTGDELDQVAKIGGNLVFYVFLNEDDFYQASICRDKGEEGENFIFGQPTRTIKGAKRNCQKVYEGIVAKIMARLSRG